MAGGNKKASRHFFAKKWRNEAVRLCSYERLFVKFYLQKHLHPGGFSGESRFPEVGHVKLTKNAPNSPADLNRRPHTGGHERIDLTKHTHSLTTSWGDLMCERKSGGRLFITAIEIKIYGFSSTGHRFAPTITRGLVYVKNPLVALTFLHFFDLTKTDRFSSTLTLAPLFL